MKSPHRRSFLQLALGTVTLPAVPQMASAQSYPSRPVRIVVGAAPGGPPDIGARMIGQWLSDKLGQPFIIENRPGAGTNIGTEAVVRAPPDGYTLLLTTASSAWNATLYRKLSFDFLRDIAPIAGIYRQSGVMDITPSFPAKTVAEFVSYAKANPGKINMASTGNGSATHIYGELFKLMAGTDIVHVPYRANPLALTALMSGEAHVFFDSLSSSMAHIKAGKLRALAVTAATRSPFLPDVPTVGEFIPGYEASAWLGVGAPKNTPSEAIDKLNREINAGLVDPGIKARIDALGATPLALSAADFGKLIASDTEKWGKVIRAANIEPV